MSTSRYNFPRLVRLSGRVAFSAVYDAKIKSSKHPLAMYGRANGLEVTRLGLSVSRAVGIAARRNRIKRLLRESFRLTRERLPIGLDVIVVVRPHEPLTLGEYQALLGTLVARVSERALAMGA